MISKKFTITQSEGKNFSLESGDNNKIHINQNYAYNSIFGKKICFGSQILIKILKIIDISFEQEFKLKISFNQPAFYDVPIYINFLKKNKLKKSIKIYQLKKFIGLIEIDQKDISIEKYLDNQEQKKKYKKKYLKTNFSFKKINYKSSYDTKLKNLLMRLSKYVGVYYPGENSLILDVEVIFNTNLKFKKFQIESFEEDARFKLIYNRMRFDSFLILFKSLERPKFDHKKKYYFSKKIKNIVKGLRDNVLLLGASQGIGLQFLQLFKLNKKIKIFATYMNNTIDINGSNISKIKLDVKKDIKKIQSIINNNSSLKIFYFISDKIYFDKKLDKKTQKNYKKIFLDIPMMILHNIISEKKFLFFYPSTTNIDIDKNSYYSKIKLKAEKKIKLLEKRSKARLIIHRFPSIYSRQSINLFNREPTSLDRYLERNRNLLKHIVNKN